MDWSGVTANTPDFDLSKLSGANGRYGQACSVSADGKTVFITSQNTSSSGGGTWIWTTTDGINWTETANLSKLSGTGGTYGVAGALSADGKTAIISGSNSNTSGCAYVWKYNEVDQIWGIVDAGSTTGYSPNADLSKTGTDGKYGLSCAISGDGTLALVCGYDETAQHGCAYFWKTTDGANWNEVANHSKSGANNKNYGESCALSIDGKTALIAGQKDANGGVAYLWTTTDGITWTETANLSSLTDGAGRCGQSCALSADGKTAIISGWLTASAGCAWIWSTTDGVTWNRIVNLSKSGVGFAYGNWCSMSADGKTVLVSGYNESNPENGGAWIWTTEDGTTWTDIIQLSNSSNTTYEFGKRCALSADGTIALISGTTPSSTTAGGAWVWRGVDQGERAQLTISGTSYDSVVPIDQESVYQVVMGAIDVNNVLGVGKLVSGESFEGIDSSVQGLAENTTLTETRYDPQVDTIFDYTSAFTNNFRWLSKITLNNGDNFYGPPQYYTGSGNAFRHVGLYTNGLYNDYAAPSSTSRPNDAYSWIFYYEPHTQGYINEIVVTYNGPHTANYTESVKEVGYVDENGTFVTATNFFINDVSETLPYSHNVTTNTHTIRFDNLLVGPNKPVKLVLGQNNDSSTLSEVYFGHNGVMPVLPTFANNSTLSTTLTSAEFSETTKELQISGEVTASSVEGVTTIYKALSLQPKIICPMTM